MGEIVKRDKQFCENNKIPDRLKIKVLSRDGFKCSKCGSARSLEISFYQNE